jgi:hypothetical protein
MRNFNAILTMMSRSNPTSYRVSVFPTAFQGPVHAIDFVTHRDFTSALQRMGIEGDCLRGIVGKLEHGESVPHLNFALSKQDAGYFGWAGNR